LAAVAVAVLLLRCWPSLTDVRCCLFSCLSKWREFAVQ
jgi:hypothetical protein